MWRFPNALRKSRDTFSYGTSECIAEGKLLSIFNVVITVKRLCLSHLPSTFLFYNLGLFSLLYIHREWLQLLGVLPSSHTVFWEQPAGTAGEPGCLMVSRSCAGFQHTNLVCPKVCLSPDHLLQSRLERTCLTCLGSHHTCSAHAPPCAHPQGPGTCVRETI